MNLTLSERIDRAEGAVECEKVMARHCYYHAAGIHREEFYELWSERSDITWAHGFGQMGDRDEYYENYILGQETNTWQGYKRLWNVYPEVKGAIGSTRRMMDYRAFNEEAMHLLTTPIIEVAEDGQSAQALWYTPGLIFSTLNPEKALEGIWMWERYAADFVKEKGEWLYLNLRVCPDVMAPMDHVRWTDARGGPPPAPEGADGDGASPPGPPQMALKIPGPLYRDWFETRVPSNDPPMPLPYKTQKDIKLYSDVHTLTD